MLYMGSYGTFLGFAAAFPLLVSAMFPLEDASGYLFVGPMLAALARLPGVVGRRVVQVGGLPTGGGARFAAARACRRACAGCG